MSDDQADSSGLRQSHHGNDAVLTTVLSMNVKVALGKNTCDGSVTQTNLYDSKVNT